MTKRLLRKLVIFCGAAAAVVCVFIYPRYHAYQVQADSYDLNEITAIPAISEVFDSNGQRYSRLSGEVRYVAPLKQISPNFVNALIAREDSRFYQHHGVDIYGILRAAWRNVTARTVREGASTLTQQLARNTFPLGDNRWERKCVEALLAMRIERHFSKDQILEAYANRIYYGRGLYGVETASQACFGKKAADLTLSEAAILAGLIRSPNRLTPLEDTRTALEQRNQVLARMEELHLISPEQATQARAEDMPAAKRLPPVLQEDYAMDAIMRDLSIVLPPELIERGGLKVYTTIDRRLQMIGQDAVADRLKELESRKGWTHPARPTDDTAKTSSTDEPSPNESPYVQGALVAIDNETGGIRAVIGGRNFKESPYNRAILSQRQVGSTIKPFIYAAAFERGLLPGTWVDDGPLKAGDIPGAANWAPENSDGRSGGLLPAALGLIRSRNTMTIRVGEYASLQAVRDLAGRAGLENVPAMPAIYLGAFESTLKNLTSAYTIFPNQGLRRQPYIIERVEDRNGQIVYQTPHIQLQCLTPEVDYVVNELLRDVLKKGTATAAGNLGLTVPAAGKTGTTDDYKDAWFVGYTSRLTCGVWVGFDRPQRIMDRGYGSALALPIWVDFIQQASQWKYDAKPFATPPDLVSAMLCRTSGLLATTQCQAGGAVYQAQLPRKLIPTEACFQHGFLRAGLQPGFTPPPPAPEQPPPLDPFLPSGIATQQASAVTNPPPAQPAGNYRMIRKQSGFIFQNEE